MTTEQGPTTRRHGLALALAALLAMLAATVSSSPSLAQQSPDARRERVYLSELALLIEGSSRLIAFTESNVDDRDLIKFAHPLAERYVEMASHMLPTPKVVVAHPHLILVVENLERALDAASSADATTYHKRMRIVRDELANLEAVLKQLKVRLPELPR